ncbi:MAG: DMT family transporter [Actinobacteria bacterium]|nr:DMT family transporter [Actinomycetota bacterium]MCA1720734.1 DMT family transporter [Actinomycetota bacterium]
MSALLALLSSAFWGLSDYLGGATSRRLPVPSVLLLSQLAGLLALLMLAGATGAYDAPRGYLLPGAVAGAVGVTALGMFYRALSIGTMGVVAPVAALGVAVPVVVGLVRGEQPSAAQAVGIVLAVVGVVLASGPELNGRGSGGALALLLAVGAAVGFGVVLVLVAAASDGDDSGAVVMTLATMRVVSVTLLGLGLLALRQRLRVAAADLPVLAAIGLADAAANGTYALASRSSLVSVAAVLASLYPVVTALLAYRFSGERLRRVQVVGVAIVLVGVGLLAGG